MRATGAATDASPLQRAARSLGLIRDRIRADGEGPFRGRLTGDGAPVELVFSSRDQRVRYTCDVAGSSVAPDLRLARAQDLSAELGAPFTFPFGQLQAHSGALEWGAWFGARHGESDEFKLYAEAPAHLSAGGSVELRGALGRYATLLDSSEYKLRIVAASPTGVEFYFRTTGLTQESVVRLLRFTGFAEYEERLLNLIANASSQHTASRFPGYQHGLSVAVNGEGQVTAFSVFAFARSFFGDDARTRTAVLKLAEQEGWDLSSYADASQQCLGEHIGGPHHGLLSFSLVRGRGSGIAVGLRAPQQHASS